MDEKTLNFLRILATTPMTKEDVLSIISEKDFDELDTNMFIIVTDDDIVISSPLLPAPPLPGDEAIRTYRRHVISQSGKFRNPIQLIAYEDRECVFSCLLNQTILTCSTLITNDEISPTELKSRVDKIHNAYRIFFGNELPPEKMDGLQTIFDKYITN